MYSHHEPCPKCGSRNNLARYRDGSAWCFGCHYWEPATHVERVRPKELSSDESKVYTKPEDAGTSFSRAAVEWLAQFHLDVPTAIKRGMLWSPSMEQLIYQMGNVWQARNFNLERLQKSKNFTSGNVNECLHIYASDGGTDVDASPSVRLVIVEDPVSAVRIAPWCDAMPLLGSHLAISRLNALAGLYSSLVFWLDSDKYKEARDMADRAKLIGLTTKVIWTELDPKCHTDEQIKGYLA